MGTKTIIPRTVNASTKALTFNTATRVAVLDTTSPHAAELLAACAKLARAAARAKKRGDRADRALFLVNYQGEFTGHLVEQFHEYTTSDLTQNADFRLRDEDGNGIVVE